MTCSYDAIGINQIKRNESDARTVRALLGKSSERTHQKTAVAVVVEPAEIVRTEEEVPREDRIFRKRRGGPVEAARAGAVEIGRASCRERV